MGADGEQAHAVDLTTDSLLSLIDLPGLARKRDLFAGALIIPRRLWLAAFGWRGHLLTRITFVRRSHSKPEDLENAY